MVLYNELSDNDLIALVKNGDNSAYAEIYNRYWGIMFIHAFKMLDDRDEAEDVVQEVFINLWTRTGDLNLSDNLNSYFFSSVRNKVLNLMRGKKRRAGHIDLFSMYVEDSVNLTLERIHEKELSEAIEEVIQSLPTKMKEVFELSRKDLLTHRQIAEKLNISEKTVKRQVSNVLKILRNKLNWPDSLILAVILFNKF